ncbi:MAG: hypothetical protein U0790_21970 [Isosphaeraceae bacterium]
MTRITLDRETIELLRNLDEPMEFCDETGWMLGRFMPEAHELVEAAVSAEEAHLHEVEASLGEEMSVYGYEQDLE